VRIAEVPDDAIMMDSGATNHVISSKHLLTNVRESIKTYAIAGFNGSEERSNLVGEFGPFGTAVYLPKSTKNILALGRLKGVIHVDFDQNAGFCTRDNTGKEYHFRPRGQLLQYAEGSPAQANAAVGEAQTMQVTVEQLKRAKVAREAERIMGYLSPGMLAYALRSGAIRDAPFTANDIALAYAVLGEDIARLKGKSVRPSAVPNVLNMDGTMSALKHQDLFIDNIHLESRWFLLSVVAPMGQL
jgi:hypothetical protein